MKKGRPKRPVLIVKLSLKVGFTRSYVTAANSLKSALLKILTVQQGILLSVRLQNKRFI